jgi:hypothetical protein
MTRRTTTLFFSRFLCAQLLLAHAAWAEPGGLDRWYIVEIDGSKAGWAREAEVRDENDIITSTSELHFTFQRMGQESKVSASTRFVETEAGDLVEMGSAQTLGTEEVKETYTFIRGIAAYEVRRVTETVGGKKEETLPWPEGEWRSPAMARRLVEQHLRDGAETITYSTLDPSAGLTVVTLTQRIVNRNAIVEAAGKTVPAVEWEVTNSLMPGMIGRDFVDPRGVALRSELNFGGMKMTMLASEKEAALSDFAPPEMMAQTLVKPEGKKIERPREATRGVYILSLADGADMPDLPSVGAQVAERLDAKRVRVEVVRGRTSDDPCIPNQRHGGRPPERIPEWEPCIVASTMIDNTDSEIVKIRSNLRENRENRQEDGPEALPFETHEWPVLRRLTRFVRDHIEDASLSVGFASASEVVRTRRGDCTEHAVLLAALVRINGFDFCSMPSRVVSGVVLVPGPEGESIFGYHMWAQGQTSRQIGNAMKQENGGWSRAIDRRWLDLDAAILPSDSDSPGVDATHIALSTSTMADGEMINSMASLVGLLGRLKIEVVEVE